MVRIYFASRDKNNKSYAGFFDYNLANKSIIYFTRKPILVPEMEFI